MVRQLFHEARMRTSTPKDLERQVRMGRQMARQCAMDAFDSPPPSLVKKAMVVHALVLATKQLKLSEQNIGQASILTSQSLYHFQ